MARIGMHRNAADPAHRVVLDQLQRQPLDQCEYRGQFMMEVRDRMDIQPRPQDLAMQVDLGRRPQALRPFERVAVEIADQQVGGFETRPALVERLDQERVAARQPRADMAAVAEQAQIVEQQRARRDLVAQRSLLRNGLGDGQPGFRHR
jgi:hypothetical protein